MSERFSLKQGEELVGLARKAINYYLHTAETLEEKAFEKEFEENRGVFVSLHSFPEMDLRGCIGFPEAVMPLWSAVIHAATSSAFSDPRFMRLQSEELEKVIVEVSVLTKPEEMKGEKSKIPKILKKGRHGLIVKKEYNSGLLLPQVWTELDCSAEEFLQHTCIKAGLNQKAWKEKETKIFRFEAQIFCEKEPKGKIEEKK